MTTSTADEMGQMTEIGYMVEKIGSLDLLERKLLSSVKMLDAKDLTAGGTKKTIGHEGRQVEERHFGYCFGVG